MGGTIKDMLTDDDGKVIKFTPNGDWGSLIKGCDIANDYILLNEGDIWYMFDRTGSITFEDLFLKLKGIIQAAADQIEKDKLIKQMVEKLTQSIQNMDVTQLSSIDITSLIPPTPSKDVD